MGNRAGDLFRRSQSTVVDPQGRVWVATDDGVSSISPDGRQVTCFPITRRFPPAIHVLAADGQYVYFEVGGSIWRLDCPAYLQAPNSEPLLPSSSVRIRGFAAGDAGGVRGVFGTSAIRRRWPSTASVGNPARKRTFKTDRKSTLRRSLALTARWSSRTTNRFHLFDAEGHAVADSAEELALKHGDRLRKALRYPPQDNIDYGHQLVKDAAGRIWWARWPAGWGVVDGTTAIRGEMDDLMKRGA